MRRGGGFTLVETMLGMLLLLAAAAAILPAYVQDIMLGQVLWERRLAVRFIEGKLDQACNGVRAVGGFNALVNIPTNAAGLPVELSGGSWGQAVVCVNGANLSDTAPYNVADGTCPVGYANLKRVRATVDWTSRGRGVNESSVDYLIGAAGVCGAQP